MKKFFALFTCLIFLFSYGFSVFATEYEDEVIIHDLDNNQRIDYLFDLRLQLESNYEENIQYINEIDLELAELGVESIRYEELLYKLGHVAIPAVEIGYSTLTNWTSRRLIVTYRGTHYEIQIIEGVPISDQSPLRIDNLVVDEEAGGFAAGSLNLLDIVAETLVSEIPVVGDVATVYAALKDAIEGYYDAYSETTVMQNVSCAGLVSMLTHMKYIFVKAYGSNDNAQVLCYLGNSVAVDITTVSAVDIFVDGTLEVKHVSETSEYTVSSEYYNDYSIATRTYYYIRNNVTANYTIDYSIKKLRFIILGQSVRMSVPYENAPIIQ